MFHLSSWRQRMLTVHVNNFVPRKQFKIHGKSFETPLDWQRNLRSVNICFPSASSRFVTLAPQSVSFDDPFSIASHRTFQKWVVVFTFRQRESLIEMNFFEFSRNTGTKKYDECRKYSIFSLVRITLQNWQTELINQQKYTRGKHLCN